MRVAVLGASGMLGSMLVEYLSPRFDVTGTTRKEFDALNPDWQVLASYDWIINAIGIIPQRHGQDRTLMLKVNAHFPHELRLHTSAKIIQIATDCVFTGFQGNYSELAPSDALDTYGLTKHMGEVWAPHFYNLRCSIVGQEPEGSYSLLKWFLSQPQGATIDGYFNQLWNGITTLQFAKICEGIIKNNPILPPVQHIIPEGYCSKGLLLEYFKEAFNRPDIIIRMKQTERKDRRLTTINPANNRLVWELAGYEDIPTIKEMVGELVECLEAKVCSR
jgi:dTDP-4-dehydrorhamnose reductase